MNIIITIILAVISAFACSAIAKKKARSRVGWFIGGFLFAYFALILLLCLPSKDKK